MSVAEPIAAQLQSLDECIAMATDFPRRSGPASGPHRRVLSGVEHILDALHASGAIVGGLAVVHHGYLRYTRDVNIVLAADVVNEFLRLAPLQGFRVVRRDRYGWHRLVHKETGMELHLVPQGAKPRRGAVTRIPGPQELGAPRSGLGFPTLARLIELKVASARIKDQADVVELIKEHWKQRDAIRKHLQQVHATLLAEFDRLVGHARQERSRPGSR
jgi:hypothetical protein